MKRLAALLILLIAGGALPALAAGQPTLQGKWTLNEDLTARMRESDRPEGGGGPRGGFGPPPGGGSGGQRGGHRPEGGGDFPSGPPPGGPGGPGGPAFSREALNELTITQKDGVVTITDKEGHARVLKTDGSKVMEEHGPGGSAEVRSSWEKDGTLTVRVKPEQGPKRTETYIVSNDGKHLYVTTLLESDGRRPARKIRRAYDPAQ